MSHVAEVKMKVLDLDALSAACDAIGLQFKAGQRTYKWFGRWMNDYSGNRAAVTRGHDPKNFGKCDHAIEVRNNPSAYGIGLVPALDGIGYDMLYDNWQQGHGLEEVAGSNLDRLNNEYQAQVGTRALARENALAVEREETADYIVVRGLYAD